MSESIILHKSLIKATSPISGYYRYSDVFQIYPSASDGRDQNCNYALIEYNTKYLHISKKCGEKKDDRLETLKKERAHLNFLKEILALLSICTNERYELDFNKSESFFPHSQQIIPKFTDVSEYLKISSCVYRINQKSRYNDQSIRIHPKTDEFFRNYLSLSSKARRRYNASIFLYDNGEILMSTAASMAVVAFASSIENMVEFENQRIKNKAIFCHECGQRQYKISSSFYDFLDKFCGGTDNDSNRKFKKFYNMRSKIVHAGSILEFDRIQTIFPQEEHDRLCEFSTLARIALFEYLLRYPLENEDNFPVANQ